MSKDKESKLSIEQMIELHKLSDNHRDQILSSEICGCFCCCQMFSPLEIHEWIDKGNTALCPHCGVDSVIGPRSMLEIALDIVILQDMEKYWFNLNKKS